MQPYLTNMIQRKVVKDILADAQYFPVLGIIGPRQVGKATLAKSLQPLVSSFDALSK